ncbi:MAG: endonuclease/exonuclease/phosphatase family protein [Catalinimonas sp.]
MKYVLYAFSGFFVLASALPYFKTDLWWVRIFDFPRVQIFLFSVVLLVVNIWQLKFDGVAPIIFTVLLALALAHQAYMIAPFTPLYPKQAKSARRPHPDRSFRFMVSNVRMENDNYDAYVALVKKTDPDLLLVNEPDQVWADHMRDLDAIFPHRVLRPLDNTYGMMLYSKLPLHETQVNYLVEEGIPSIHTLVELPSGNRFELYCVHPTPPEIGSNTDDRDAELLIVGKRIEKSEYASMVAGDLNDVAWSYTTKLFQRISQTLDPRVGRGFFNTYSAYVPFFRYPLDHVFYSAEFKLVHMERLEKFGSDHFPILIELNYEPHREHEQEVPAADAEEEQEAREKIRKPFEEKAKE